MNAQFVKLTRAEAGGPNDVTVHMRHTCKEFNGKPYRAEFSLRVKQNYAGGKHGACGCHTVVPLKTWMRWYHRHNFARRLAGEI